MIKSFKSSRAPEPVGAFPHAKCVGDFLFLSGIGPPVRGSKEIPGVTLDPAGNSLVTTLKNNAMPCSKCSARAGRRGRELE
jgi:enamine deaminase RidA (YjgF/YER057c/UK114 family)